MNFKREPKKCNKGLLVEFKLESVRILFLEKLNADLLRDNLGADEILLGQAQSHLLKNQLNLNYKFSFSKNHVKLGTLFKYLFSPFHGAISLYLKLLKDIGCLCNFSICFLHLG